MRVRVQEGENVSGGQELRLELLQVFPDSAYFVGVNYTAYDKVRQLFNIVLIALYLLVSR